MTTSAVSLDLTKAFDTISHAILGSLSNDDRAQRERQKKTIDLLSKTITLHVQLTFLYISLPSLHDYDVVKMLNFTFYVGRENQNNDFLFSFVNLETVL